MTLGSIDVVLLEYPGAQIAALHGLEDLFRTAVRLATDGDGSGRQKLTVRRCIVPFSGSRIKETLVVHPAAVIVPPTLTARPEEFLTPELEVWLKGCRDAGTVLAGICAGSFLLAQAGVLDGRNVTVHWSQTERLSRLRPDVRVHSERLFVEDIDVVTTAGIMSWPDMALRLIERWLGTWIMHETSRFMMLDPPRVSQRPYRRLPLSVTFDDPQVQKLLHWLRTSAGGFASVRDMAHMAGLEERTLLRRFRKATGLSPRDYRQHLAVERARALLETTALSVDQIAYEIGYQNPDAFRKLFIRLTGLTPAAHRRRCVNDVLVPSRM